MTKIDPASLMPVAEGNLKTNGEKYYVGFFDESHIDAIKTFHDHIVKKLNPGEQAFFLQKSRSFFAEHFKKGHGNTIIGIISIEGNLLAQAIILHPTNKRPKTGMVEMILPANPADITILQGVGVLPELRGNGLMQEIVKCWLDYAARQKRTHAIAEVDILNVASWSVFLKEGLNIVSTGIDPADGTLVYNVHEKTKDAVMKRLAPIFNEYARTKRFASKLENIEWHQKLFEEGYKCTGFNKEQGILIFEKPEGPD